MNAIKEPQITSACKPGLREASSWNAKHLAGSELGEGLIPGFRESPAVPTIIPSSEQPRNAIQ